MTNNVWNRAADVEITLRRTEIGRARALLGCSSEMSLLDGVRSVKADLTDAERVIALLRDAVAESLKNGHGKIHEDWCYIGPDDDRCNCPVGKMKKALAEAEKISIMPRAEDSDAP